MFDGSWRQDLHFNGCDVGFGKINLGKHYLLEPETVGEGCLHYKLNLKHSYGQ